MTAERAGDLSRRSSPMARRANLVLGVWLFISPFLWPHSLDSRPNTRIVGLLITVCAAIAVVLPVARWANTALAVWLFLSTLTIFHVETATSWDNVIVSILVLVFSLAPSMDEGVRRPQRPLTTT